MALVFALCLGSNILSVRLFGYWDLPPKNRDGVDYECIAFNLAQGHGYGRNWGDPQWREPYVDHNPTGRYRRILDCTDPYSATAYRPPGLPFLLAGIYNVWGRDFLVFRLVNCGIFALTVALAVGLAWRVATPVPAVIVAGLGVCDPILKKYAGYFLTEGLACLGVVLLAWSAVLLAQRRALRYVALVGVVLGGLVLCRSVFVLWYPLGLGLVVWLGWGNSKPNGLARVAGTRDRPADPPRHGVAAAVLVFLTTALLVPLPWWVRNCVVLDAFMPLGTQGGIGLPGGYSAAAVQANGHWVNLETFGGYDAFFDQVNGRGLSGIELEKQQAQYGQRMAVRWILTNPLQVPKLALSKLIQLWIKPRFYSLLLLGVACLGLRWAWPKRAVGVLWAIVAYNSLVVMVTYVGGGGRFLVPVWLILYTLVGIGLWRCGVWWYQRQSRPAALEPCGSS